VTEAMPKWEAVPGGPITRLVPIPATTVSVPIFAGNSLITGWSFKEATGAAPAECWLIDGNDIGGQPFAFITLLAGQSIRDLTAYWGVNCTTGLFLRVISGSVQGSVWAVDL
jgi:hypothetical protein